VRTHYQPEGWVSPVCGRGGDYPSVVAEVSPLVDCGRCMSTDAYYRGLLRVQAAEESGQNLANEAIKAALDSVFESAYKVADRAGYCSTFEEIVGDIEVPSWYEVPARGEHFDIEVVYGMSEVIAANEDEAYAMIAADVRKYIALSS